MNRKHRKRAREISRVQKLAKLLASKQQYSKKIFERYSVINGKTVGSPEYYSDEESD